MEEKEIKEILAKYLMSASESGIEIAVAATMCESEKTALDLLLKGEQINEKHLAIVMLAIEAKISLCIETFINFGETPVLIPGGSPEAFLEIYSKLNTITQFLDSNLEDLKFGPRVNKKTVQKNLNQILATIRSRHKQIKSEGGGVSNDAETRYISYLLDLAIQLILGEETFGRFIDEVNSIMLVLDKIKSGIVIPKSGNAQRKRKPS